MENGGIGRAGRDGVGGGSMSLVWFGGVVFYDNMGLVDPKCPSRTWNGISLCEGTGEREALGRSGRGAAGGLGGPAMSFTDMETFLRSDGTGIGERGTEPGGPR